MKSPMPTDTATETTPMQRNLVALGTIVRREITRILRIWGQTLVPPAITMTLYFIIFGSLVGSRIGGIRLEKLLGRGAMGAVFLGLQESLERKVAVKVLSSAPLNEEASAERFFKEARAVEAEDGLVVRLVGLGVVGHRQQRLRRRAVEQLHHPVGAAHGRDLRRARRLIR